MPRLLSFHHAAFSVEALASSRRQTISVCLPARDEAATIGPILKTLVPLRERGLLDEVIVLDDSTDGTAEIAARHGATVYAQSALVPELGAVEGKGDAMWRGLAVARGDIVCFLDADSEDLGEHFVTGLVGPLLTEPQVRFVKAFYRRPWQQDGIRRPEGGGRVTEILARPLLQRFYPDLGDVRQPLAGEIAARRDLLLQLPFCCGYAVDIALLIDAWKVAGTAGLAQVDLDVRQNRHRPLGELNAMASAVLAGVTTHLSGEQRLTGEGAHPGLAARPPMADYLERAPRSRFTVASAYSR